MTAEVALMTGDAVAAVGPAEQAAALAARRGALRHSVKSRLVLAAALAGTGAAEAGERAAVLVPAALADARTAGLRSLTWPAGLLAADLDPAAAVRLRAEVTAELHALSLRSDPQGRRLARESAWVPL
ncbi:hypothetical protein CFN78_01640 [Amycolatopsis antarctica]|uniref:Uncharacterized protein n=1 Tax=Amycolatopsis antarctica TaxID=1854586 RepID=A0A263DBQ3_9PSEU|nr:hypothetical protein CFN78_01640 [Amycolatopsis antarctica]